MRIVAVIYNDECKHDKALVIFVLSNDYISLVMNRSHQLMLLHCLDTKDKNYLDFLHMVRFLIGRCLIEY